MTAREVAVVGAGIVGAATARELAVRGVDVVLLDAGEASGGTTGLGKGNVLCSDKDAGPELELSLRELWGASLFEADLQCAPREIALALAREAAEAGAGVRTGARVEAVARTDGPSSRVAGVVLADGERIGAGAVVIAAGPWSAALAEPAGAPLPLEPRKGQLVLLNGSDPLIRHKVVDGPVTGRLIAQLYCGEPPVVDPAPFDPDRFGR